MSAIHVGFGPWELFSPSFYMENIDDNCRFYDSQYTNMTLNVACIEEYFDAGNN